MPYDHSERLTSVNGVPTLERRYADGNNDTLEGFRAIANAGTARANAWKNLNPQLAYQYGSVPKPGTESIPHAIGRSAGELGDYINDSFIGSILNKGPLAGAALGGGTGLVGGLAVNWLANKLLGVEVPHLGLIGGVAGAALGGLAGHERTTKSAATGFVKRSAMFKDPRNFILEKLQLASDVSAIEKMQLAAKVRAMDPVTAKRLADAVRASLGFGVGAIIAKFLGKSALSGGFAGILGMALMAGLARKNPYVPSLF